MNLTDPFSYRNRCGRRALLAVLVLLASSCFSPDVDGSELGNDSDSSTDSVVPEPSSGDDDAASLDAGSENPSGGGETEGEGTAGSVGGVEAEGEGSAESVGGVEAEGDGPAESVGGGEVEGEGTGIEATSSTTDAGTSEGVPDLRPQAADDVYRIRQGETLTISAAEGNGLLQNDRGGVGQPLAVVEQTLILASGATVRLRGDGSFQYQPDSTAVFWGEESFEYTVIDVVAEQATGQVRIVVSPTAIPLSRVTEGVGGFTMNGETAGDAVGVSVGGAGDVNGDGLNDIVVGSRGGRTYIVFGTSEVSRASPLSLGAVAQGQGGFALDEELANDGAGVTVFGAGDINGDSLADVLIGASGSDVNGSASGRAYVVFGRRQGAAVPISLSTIALGQEGFAMNGEATGNRAGQSVNALGDLNDDGYADVLVSANEALPNETGRTYVVFGGSSLGSPISLSAVALGDGGFSINGQAGDYHSGITVGRAGDVNGDGVVDILVSAIGVDGATGSDSPGRVYVVFGSNQVVSPVSLADVERGVGGFAIDGEVAGDDFGEGAVSGAGDVNGDGLADVIVGADRNSISGNASGRSYVLLGRRNGPPISPVSLQDVVNGELGFAIDGEAELDLSGTSVSGAGDVNGDGLSDMIVGAGGGDPNGASSGRSYVIFGQRNQARVLLAAVARGEGGFVIDGEVGGDASGRSVGAAGDVNADGFDDVLVGADGADPIGSGSGRAYVIYGGDFTLSATASP